MTAALCWRGAGDATRARAALQRARTLAASFTAVEQLPLDLLDGDLLLDAAQENAALQLAQRLRVLAPASRAALHLQARALLAMPRSPATLDFLRQQTVLHPHDVDLWRWRAQAEAAAGKGAAQHRATAEAYALQGNLEGAIVQLKIAQTTPDTDYFEASIVDARLNLFKQRLARDKILDKMIPQ
ncbi:beta-barrel assembly-enhancing protease [mine drainage metagenome]|uniref:Beta-barrel assembly-enhancing protease n=1 Tax=mine drainage metagenome TaxID=410659 RepID=A0A1J5PU22_9ZZZZ